MIRFPWLGRSLGRAHASVSGTPRRLARPPRTMVVVYDTDPDDPFDLARFVRAQEHVYASVRRELEAGEKTGHWMWFVFPQAEGLGWSEMSRRYAIRSLDEARAYLDHPILGRRLRDAADLLLRLQGRTAAEVFGQPDDLKLRSSMTLFALAAGGGSPFERVLERYFDGEVDAETVQIVSAWDVRGSGEPDAS